MSRLLLVFALSFLLPVAGDDTLSAGWPAGVPDGAALGWERIDGELETTESALVYRFYVNPARPAIYEVARYHFVKIEGAVRTPYTEKIIWNKYPTGGKGPRCFALESGSWRPLEHGSTEYQNEMGMAMYVYGVHRRQYEN